MNRQEFVSKYSEGEYSFRDIVLEYIKEDRYKLLDNMNVEDKVKEQVIEGKRKVEFEVVKDNYSLYVMNRN